MAGELITADRQIQWAGQLWGDGTGVQVGAVTGWDDLPPVDSGTAPRAQQHGSYLGRLLSQSRIITADMRMTSWPNDLPAARRALLAATSLLQGEQSLVIRMCGETQMVTARLFSRTMPSDTDMMLGTGAVSLAWEATDPRRYDLAEQAGQTALPTAESGLAWGAETLTRNLVLNPSAEVDLTDTQAYGPSITRARVTTDAAPGGNSASIQHTFTADASAGSTWSIEPTTGTGTVVRVGIWVKIPASGVTSMLLAWRSGTTTLNTAAVTLPTAGTWTRMTGSYTLTAGQTCDRVGLSIVATNGTVYWLDAAMASTAAALPSYGDGSTSGWWWDGTAHDSTSRTVTGSGLVWGSPEASVGLAWGSPGSTGDITATNAGDAESHPTITITGPCTTPSVTLQGTTPVVLEYDLTVGAGEQLAIDTWAGTVLLGGQSRLGYATARSQPEGSFVLPPGASPQTVSFRSADAIPSPAASAVVRWRNAYW
jgi:hypothetical protein